MTLNSGTTPMQAHSTAKQHMQSLLGDDALHLHICAAFAYIAYKAAQILASK